MGFQSDSAGLRPAARLDPNDLILFMHVVEQAGFKRAAERLGVPHSTISRRIMLLEGHLGEKLLHRTTRRLSLTDFGATVLAHARHIEAEVAATAELVESRTAEPSGHLRVSIPTDFTGDMLGAFLARFTSRFPKVLLDVDVSRRRVDLVGENVDVAVRIGELQDDATLAARRIGTIKTGLYAAPAYLGANGPPTSPDDLAAHRVLHLTQRLGEGALWRLRSGQDVWEGTLAGRITANSPGILMHLAINGAGIAPLANHLAADNVRAGLLERVLPDWEQNQSPIWAVFPGRRLLPARVQAFIDALKQELAA